MNGGGSLKKRRRRPIAKVPGLSLIPYDLEQDPLKNFNLRPTSKFRLKHRHPRHDSIFISDLLEGQETQKSGSDHSPPQRYEGRATRNPNFSYPYPNAVFSTTIDEEDEVCYPEDDGRSSAISSAIAPDDHYILSKHTLFKLRLIILLGSTTGAVPWSWNSKENRIDVWRPSLVKLWSVFSLLYFLQTTALTGFQIWSFYNRVVEQEERNYRAIFQSSFATFWYVCAVYFYLNMVLHKDEIRQYINTLLECNREFVGEYVVSTEGYREMGTTLTTFFVYCNITQIFVSVAIFIGMPYLPSFLISYIYEPATTPWFYLIPGAIQEFVVIGQVIFSFILTSWSVVAHSNTVAFWTSEIHQNNETGWTKGRLRHPLRAVGMYRSLQILCSCFNHCMSPMAIPMIKLHMVSGLIPCGYVLVKSIDPEIIAREFPGILSYPVAYIDGISVSVAILTMPAIMYDLSTGFIESWSRTRNMDFRKILISFPALKIKVGRFYHITTKTTITYFKVLTDFIIDTIITFK